MQKHTVAGYIRPNDDYMPRELRITAEQLTGLRTLLTARPLTLVAVSARLGMASTQLSAALTKWGMTPSDTDNAADAMAEIAKAALDVSIDLRERARVARRAQQEGRQNFTRLAGDPAPADQPDATSEEMAL